MRCETFKVMVLGNWFLYISKSIVWC